MSIVIQNGNSVKVVDSNTRQAQYTVNPPGTIMGTPMIQGKNLTMQVAEGGTVKTKIYDAKTGQLQGSL